MLYSTYTRRLIESATANLPHALLLEGVEGVGLGGAAREIAWRNLAATIQATDANGDVDISAKGIIRVSQIRAIVTATRGKTNKRQVYIIDEADKMNTQAQNAFLKLLEEPTAHVHFILTSHAPHTLLPTVLSRVQRLHIQPISREDSQKFITKHGVHDEQTVRQLLFLANGRPAELSRLMANDSELARRAAIMTDARTFIQGTSSERVLVASQYVNDRVSCLHLLASAQTIIRYSVSQRPTKALVTTADAIATAYDRISANGNVRLQLLNLVV